MLENEEIHEEPKAEEAHHEEEPKAEDLHHEEILEEPKAEEAHEEVKAEEQKVEDLHHEEILEEPKTEEEPHHPSFIETIEEKAEEVIHTVEELFFKPSTSAEEDNNKIQKRGD